MRKHTLEIADKKSQVFRLRISTPSAGSRVWTAITDGISTHPEGSWRSIDKGFIQHHNGKTFSKQTYNSKDMTTRDIYLLDSNENWGIQIFEYEDWIDVNDVGKGFVIQPWVLSLAVGKFSWSVVD